MAGGALISADAITAGNGGTVVVWADNHTRFDGTITARGGAQRGDGGKVETSGKETLDIRTGKVDASAPKGKGGQWLLDPRNVTIAASSTDSDGTDNGTFTGGTFTPTGNDAVITAATIQAALNAGTDVTVNTGSTGGQDGNITVAAAITWGTTATLALDAAGSITLSQSVTGTAGTLAMTGGASGNITQGTGVTIKVSTLRASTGGAVTLANANEVGTLGAFSAGNGFTFNNAGDGLVLSGVTTGTAGTVSITTAGDLAIQGNLQASAISLSSTGTISQSGGTITTATLGATAASDGSGDITLTQGNAIGALGTVSAGGDISITNADTGLTVTGTVTAGGDIGIDTGTGTFATAAAGKLLTTAAITLTADSMALATGSQIGGSAADTGSAASVTLRPASGGRAITLAGAETGLALSTDELATVRATDVGIGRAGAGAISVGSLTPAATFATGTLALISGAGIDFAGDLTLASNLAVTAGGAVTQQAKLEIAGTTMIGAAGQAVTLDNADNDFQGAVGITAGTVSIADAGALTIGGGTGALTVTAGALTFSTLNAASIAATAGGAITQSGDLTVAGAASFAAGANAITLDRAGNDFQGTVALSNSGANAVSLATSGALQLAASGVGSGTLSLTAGGHITQTGAITCRFRGAITLGLTAAGSDIILDASNSLNGTVTLTGAGNLHDFSLRNLSAAAQLPSFAGATGLNNLTIDFPNAAVTLSGFDIDGDLTITAGGAVTQTAAIAVSGTTGITATGQSVTLDRSENDFTGAVGVVGGATAISDANALTVGGSTGALTLNSGALTFSTLSASSIAATAAGIAQTGDITVSGTSSFASGANSITLDRDTNSFGGAVSLANSGANAILLGTAGDLVLGAGTIGSGTLSIRTGGDITQTGALIQAAGAVRSRSR